MLYDRSIVVSVNPRRLLLLGALPDTEPSRVIRGPA
jgi:hypothetical protein